jgi:hypothetical protein
LVATAYLAGVKGTATRPRDRILALMLADWKLWPTVQLRLGVGR